MTAVRAAGSCGRLNGKMSQLKTRSLPALSAVASNLSPDATLLATLPRSPSGTTRCTLIVEVVPFFAAAALALSNVTFGFLIVPESLRAENRRPFSFAQANPFGAFMMIRKQIHFLRLFIALGFMHITASTVPLIWGFITTLKFGWSPADIGVSISLRVIATVVAQAVLLSYFTRWLGNPLTACAGFVFLIIGMFGYAFATQEWIILASIVPSALGQMTGPAVISHMSCHTPPDRQGELQGTIGCVVSAGNILAPLVMVELFSRFSEKDARIYFPGAPFLLAALLASCGLLLVIQAFKPSALLHSQAAE